MKHKEGDLEKTRQTYKKLFKADDFEKTLPFDFDYDGDKVDDSIPSKEEITKALFKI